MSGGSDQTGRDIRSLPKAHLHLHFTGSMRHSTLLELATRDGEDVRMLAPGQRFGYPVDAGTGCFADATADIDADDVLAQIGAHEEVTWSWALSAGAEGGHRVVAFSSGFGDGIYATWIGRGEHGEIACLVTDFRCLEALELPELPDDPAFRAAHVRRRLDEQLLNH